MHIVIPILIFFLIIGLVIFVHELGHYMMARRAGVFVEEFALGMGPKLIGFNGKQNERGEQTLYSLRAFPIGGFCKMRGEDDAEPDDPGALNTKSIKARMLVMVGGSAMNFLLAIILFLTTTVFTGVRVAEVVGFLDDSPAFAAGLEIGDRVTHINGVRVSLYENFLIQMELTGGNETEVRINRNGERHTYNITPMVSPDGQFLLGIQIGRRYGILQTPPEGYRRLNPIEAITTSTDMIAFNIRLPFQLLARFISGQNLPEGAAPMGPIGMAGEITNAYQVTIQRGVLDTIIIMILIAGIISVALGIMNLLPIPGLDGARLMFLLIEAIRRKPVPVEKEAVVHFVGLVALILFAVFIAYRDIVRLL